MGLHSSKEKSQNELGEKVAYLEKRVTQLEYYNNQLLDKLSTYREIEIKVDECYEKIGLDKASAHQQYLVKTELELNDSKKQIVELEKQLGILNELHKKRNISSEYKMVAADNKTNTFNEMSKKQIELIVNKLLADEEVNIKYFPDFVERQLYENVIHLVINLLNHFLSETNVNLLGHTIKFILVPQAE